MRGTVLYSINVFLKFFIEPAYRHDVHYAWCDTLQPTDGLVGTSWGNPKLRAGCPPELPGVEPGYVDTLLKHADEHWTHTSVRVWDPLCARLKARGSLSHCLIGSLRQRRPLTDAWQRLTVQREVNHHICGSWVRATRASPPPKAAPLDGARHATSGSYFYESMYSLEFSSNLLTVHCPTRAAGAPGRAAHVSQNLPFVQHETRPR